MYCCVFDQSQSCFLPISPSMQLPFCKVRAQCCTPACSDSWSTQHILWVTSTMNQVPQLLSCRVLDFRLPCRDRWQPGKNRNHWRQLLSYQGIWFSLDKNDVVRAQSFPECPLKQLHNRCCLTLSVVNNSRVECHWNSLSALISVCKFWLVLYFT